MNEVQVKILEDIFSMVPEGTFADIDELQEFIEDEGVEELFTMVPEGVFEDEEQFEEFVTPLKKKTFLPLVLPKLWIRILLVRKRFQNKDLVLRPHPTQYQIEHPIELL
jgi:hypothetical protein